MMRVMLQIYSWVSFRADRSRRDKNEVFTHEIQEVKGDRHDRLLHNVVEKQCRYCQDHHHRSHHRHHHHHHTLSYNSLSFVLNNNNNNSVMQNYRNRDG